MACEICRICLKEGILSSIFNKIDSVAISTQIMSITKIQINPDDGLPNKICSNCIKSLKNCSNFIKLCELSDLKLRAHLQRAEECRIESLNLCNSGSCSDLFSEEYGDNTHDKSYIEICLSPVRTANTDATEDEAPLVIDEDKLEKCNKRKEARKEQCFTCGKVMSSRFRLKTHLRTHTGEKPYTCIQCGKKFTLEQSLKIHTRTHTGEKPLSCTVCNATFAQPAGLVAHRRKHTGQTPYQCTLCPRSFRTAGHLKYHVRCHTGEKNFECEICSRAFITRGDLKQHSVVHSGHKPHVCPICGLGLARAAHLKRHLATHNETDKFDDEETKDRSGDENPSRKAHVCYICDLSVSRLSYLKKHMAVHHNPLDIKDFKEKTDEKTCGVAIGAALYLKTHMAVHNNSSDTEEPKVGKDKHPLRDKVKAHDCSVCDLSVGSVAVLKRHIATHHSTSELRSTVVHHKDILYVEELKTQ